MLFDYLATEYCPGELIFIKDIHLTGISRVNFIQQLKTLTDNGKIIRYEKGIYYIPKINRFGHIVAPSPEVVAQCKYISRNGKVDGYYSGGTFANLIGLSFQVPMKKEIVSNNISATVRDINIGKQTFIVRRTNVPICKENVLVLQFLELLKNLDNYIDINDKSAKDIIANYTLTHHLQKNDIDKYIRYYPDSTFRFYYETGLNDVLT